MSAPTTSNCDFEVLLADQATWLPLMISKPEGAADGAPPTLTDALAAASNASPITEDMDTAIQEDWSRGAGIDYDAAYSVYTRTPGYALPAGAATGVQVTLSLHDSNTPLVAFTEYLTPGNATADLYIAQRGTSTGVVPLSNKYGRVLKLTGGTGTAAEVMIIGTTAGCNLVGSSFYIRDMIVADDGAGTNVLFVSASDINGLNGVLYKFDGTNWSSSAAVFGANGRNRMAYVNWTTSDGNTANRLVPISGAKTIAYTTPNSDPLLAASWVENVKIGTGGTLLELAAFRRHVYPAATDDLYDVNELGESMGLTTYLRTMIQTGNGLAVQPYGDYVYMAVGRGLIRVRVADGAVLNEKPQQCAPCWGTPAKNDARGYVTAMCVDQGYLVVAVYNPTTQKSYIWWGIEHGGDRDTLNPLYWYGPEVTFSIDFKVTRIMTSGLAGDLRLWIASQSSVGGSTARLDWVSLPIAGSPIQDLVSAGAHKFAIGAAGVPSANVQPFCYLDMLEDSRGDKAQKKIIYLHSVGSQGPLDTNTKLDLYTRADPAPNGSTTWSSAGSITASPSQDIVPVTVTQGQKTQVRVNFISPHGADSTPTVAVLDSLRTLAWKVAPAFRVVTLQVAYGDGVMPLRGSPEREIHPDTKKASLKALTEFGRTSIRDRNDKVWTVKFRQVLSSTDVFLDDTTFHKRIVSTVQFVVLDEAA